MKGGPCIEFLLTNCPQIPFSYWLYCSVSGFGEKERKISCKIYLKMNEKYYFAKIHRNGEHHITINILHLKHICNYFIRFKTSFKLNSYLEGRLHKLKHILNFIIFCLFFCLSVSLFPYNLPMNSLLAPMDSLSLLLSLML